MIRQIIACLIGSLLLHDCSWVQSQAAEPARQPPASKVFTEKAAPAKAPGAKSAPASQPAAESAKTSGEILRSKLAEKTSCKFDKTPLQEVAEFFQEQHDVELQLDTRALGEVGVGPNVPITFSCHDISLRSALNLILRRLELTYFIELADIIEEECITITTPEVVETNPELRIYPVADLIHFQFSPPGTEGDVDSLIELITGVTQPRTWDGTGGDIKDRDELLFIRQTREAHDDIQLLLDGLRRLPQLGSPDLKQHLQPVWCTAHQTQDEKIRVALDKRIPLKFENTPLTDVAEYFARQSGLNFQIDLKAFAEVGVGVDASVTFSSHKLTLASALKRILRTLDLTYTLQDEVVLITTPEVVESHLTVAIYPVADLLNLSEQPALEDIIGELDSLIDVLQSVLESHSWDGVGGPGSIHSFTNRGALVIHQTQEIHEEITEFLSKLRRVRESQPKSELPEHNRESELQVITYTFVTPVSVQAKDAEQAKPQPEPKYDTKLLAETIQALIAPESWQNKEQTYLQAFPDRLVIRQHQDVHKQIKKLLDVIGYPYQSGWRVLPQQMGGSTGLSSELNMK